MTTLIFIPGLLSDCRVWTPLAGALAEAPGGFDIHHADVTRDDSIAAMAARILGDVAGPVLPVGHSMGGRVAIEIARQAPDRVRGLVLSNTGHAPATAAELPKREAKIRGGHADMAALVADWLPPMVAPGRGTDAALMEPLSEMAEAVGPLVHERQIRALMGRPDAGATLPDVVVPVLLMTGTEDGWSPEPQHREIAAMLPEARLEVIAGAGHFLPVEQPETVAATVRDWLSDHAGRLL